MTSPKSKLSSHPLLAVVAVGLVVFVLGPSSAVAATTTTEVFVGASCTGKGQLCVPLSPAGSYIARSPLSITYTAAGTHCSNVAVRFFVDGKRETGTGFAPPTGSVSATVPWPNDGSAHDLSVQGEGQTGGCNAGDLGSWAGTLTITYTPAPEECQAPARFGAAELSGAADQCCSISATGHAKREAAGVVTTLQVVTGGTARCQRKPVDATVDGQFIRLQFHGANGEGHATLRAKQEVCDDTLVARVRQGSLSSTDEIKIPGSTPKITFRATRKSNGKLEVTALVRNVLPTAQCSRPAVAIDGVFLRLRVQGSTATAHRELIGADACAPLAKLQYTQDKITAHASRDVTGAIPTICHAPPP